MALRQLPLVNPAGENFPKNPFPLKDCPRYAAKGC